MSSITFNARRHSAVIRGPERHMMAGLCASISKLALHRIPASVIVTKGNPAHYIYATAAKVVAAGDDAWSQRRELERQLDTYAAVGEMGPGGLFPDTDLFELQLNTVNALGSAPVRLAARIHGQCEIHLWIAGEHASDIAEVIEQGRACGLFRPDMGWEDAIEMLRTSDVGDVVLSYSVTDSFPNEYIAVSDKLPPAPNYPDEYEKLTQEQRTELDGMAADREEVWYDQMTDDERWNAAMAGLKAKGDGYQLLPGRLHDGYYGFGDGRTLFDLAEGK